MTNIEFLIIFNQHCLGLVSLFVDELLYIVLNFWISIVKTNGADHTSSNVITTGAELVMILMLKLLHDH